MTVLGNIGRWCCAYLAVALQLGVLPRLPSGVQGVCPISLVAVYWAASVPSRKAIVPLGFLGVVVDLLQEGPCGLTTAGFLLMIALIEWLRVRGLAERAVWLLGWLGLSLVIAGVCRTLPGYGWPADLEAWRALARATWQTALSTFLAGLVLWTVGQFVRWPSLRTE